MVKEGLFLPLLKDAVQGESTSITSQNCGNTQRHFKAAPLYRLVSEEGPSHKGSLSVEAIVKGEVMGKGSGARKRRGQSSAKEALKELSKEALVEWREKRLIIPVFIPFGGCPSVCVFATRKASREPLAFRRKSSYRDCRKISFNVDRNGQKKSRFTAEVLRAFKEASWRATSLQAFEFKRSGRIDSIRVSTRPDLIDDSICGTLKSYGVETVELGAQSLIDIVLRLSARGHGAADTVKAVETLKSFRLTS